MSIHTAGLWTRGKGKFAIKSVADGKIIARTKLPGGFHDRSDEECEANAKLIEQVPLLLNLVDSHNTAVIQNIRRVLALKDIQAALAIMEMFEINTQYVLGKLK